MIAVGLETLPAYDHFPLRLIVWEHQTLISALFSTWYTTRRALARSRIGIRCSSGVCWFRFQVPACPRSLRTNAVSRCVPQVFNDGMMDIDAYNPFPNAILFNWATIFVLGFGNLAALDFQVHCVTRYACPHSCCFVLLPLFFFPHVCCLTCRPSSPTRTHHTIFIAFLSVVCVFRTGFPWRHEVAARHLPVPRRLSSFASYRLCRCIASRPQIVV